MDLAAGLSCCVGAGVLYLTGRSNSEEAEFLKHIPPLNQLTGSDQLPQIVTIREKVRSDTPISCKCSGSRGVIVEESAYEDFLQRNVVETTTTTTTRIIKDRAECCGLKEKKKGTQRRETEEGTKCCEIKVKRKERKVVVSWVEKSAFMHSVRKEVPWYLDDGTSRVVVIGAGGATHFQLAYGGSTFEESQRSPEREKLDYDRGYKILGINRYECILKTGTSLTVVGQAVKEKDGTIKIQRPCKGPFYVSRQTIDQLISQLEQCGRGLKYASYALTLIGVSLITNHGIQYILDCWQQKKSYIELLQQKPGERDRKIKVLMGGQMLQKTDSVPLFLGVKTKEAKEDGK